MREYLGIEFEDKLLKNCEIKQRGRNKILFGGESKEKPKIKQRSAVYTKKQESTSEGLRVSLNL